MIDFCQCYLGTSDCITFASDSEEDRFVSYLFAECPKVNFDFTPRLYWLHNQVATYFWKYAKKFREDPDKMKRSVISRLIVSSFNEQEIIDLIGKFGLFYGTTRLLQALPDEKASELVKQSTIDPKGHWEKDSFPLDRLGPLTVAALLEQSLPPINIVLRSVESYGLLTALSKYDGPNIIKIRIDLADKPIETFTKLRPFLTDRLLRYLPKSDWAPSPKDKPSFETKCDLKRYQTRSPILSAFYAREFPHLFGDPTRAFFGNWLASPFSISVDEEKAFIELVKQTKTTLPFMDLATSLVFSEDNCTWVTAYHLEHYDQSGEVRQLWTFALAEAIRCRLDPASGLSPLSINLLTRLVVRSRDFQLLDSLMHDGKLKGSDLTAELVFKLINNHPENVDQILGFGVSKDHIKYVFEAACEVFNLSVIQALIDKVNFSGLTLLFPCSATIDYLLADHLDAISRCKSICAASLSPTTLQSLIDTQLLDKVDITDCRFKGSLDEFMVVLNKAKQTHHIGRITRAVKYQTR